MTRDNFFGRENYLALLTKRINDLKDGYRQNIAIIGDELVGKTSIIFKLLDSYYDSKIIILYIETRIESPGSFAKRFIGILLFNFMVNSGERLKEDLDFLIQKSSKYIPRAVEKIKAILEAVEKRKKNYIFIDLFSLPEIIYQESGKRCVVILDEFLQLESIGIKNLYREWSKLLMVQKNTLYIITSSRKFKTKAILSKNLSLLFGNFELVTIEPFDIKESCGYLQERLKDANLNAGLKNFMVHFTGGHPFYLEIISNAVLQSDRCELADILEKLLFLSTGILNQRFSSYLKLFLDAPHGNDYISIMHQVANGHNRIKDIAHILHKTQKELLSKTNHLLELDVLARSGDFLKINDRVFGFWLRFVYHEKIHSLTFDSKNQKAIFRDRIESMIQEFLKNSNISFKDRLTELLRLFEDDIIQIEKKKLRLSHFREIKPLSFNSQSIKEGLIGRSRDSLWILAFKNDTWTEEDITTFSRECKKYRHKLQRKIIISLHDLDANTRLRALDEKILMWNVDSLNQILDLFSKPRVIPSFLEQKASL